MNKKAQGVSINVIIIAVIALIVLVVIIAIFLGRIGMFGAGVSECKGECKDELSCAPGEAKLTGTFSKDSTGRECAEDDICDRSRGPHRVARHPRRTSRGLRGGAGRRPLSKAVGPIDRSP